MIPKEGTKNFIPVGNNGYKWFSLSVAGRRLTEEVEGPAPLKAGVNHPSANWRTSSRKGYST